MLIVFRFGIGLNKNSNHGVSWEFYNEPLKHHNVTSTNPQDNVWWKVFAECMKSNFDINGIYIYILILILLKSIYTYIYIYMNIETLCNK